MDPELRREYQLVLKNKTVNWTNIMAGFFFAKILEVLLLWSQIGRQSTREMSRHLDKFMNYFNITLTKIGRLTCVDMKNNVPKLILLVCASLSRNNVCKKLSLLSAIFWRSFSTYLADRLLRVCEVKIKSHRILAALESRENSTRAEIWERIVCIGYCDVKHNT